ncbi:MAG TPA: ABC transporter permease [Kiritimatiellia bacterium]|nr:ABC transporter permease [Kiritimatiellia bacterium]HMP32793.1 ABC transporter permease [Kiritimatiellia bacterium]
MNAFLVLWRREMTGYFYSPVAYASMTFFLLVMGMTFYFLASVLADGVPGIGVMNLMFGSPFYWMTQMVVVPLLTMRLFAEERRTGTLETLLTAPVSDAAVVGAKFAGVYSFYLVMWMPTLLFLAVLHGLSAEIPPFDPGAVAGGYIGAALTGALFLAIGLVCSLTTSNQIIAAITCFALMILFFFSGFLEFISFHPAAVAVADYLSPHRHMIEFSRGAIDSRAVVFYLGATYFFLFSATRILESRHWK